MIDSSGSNTSEPDPVDGYSRHETEAQRLDRHWAELLQELRVAQAGSQILIGFLLTLPFQTAFARLSPEQVTVYLVLVSLVTVATVLSLAPVILHRATFRQHVRERLVSITHVLLRATLVAIALALAGTMQLVFGIVIDIAAGFIAALVTLATIAALWLTLPVFARADRASD